MPSAMAEPPPAESVAAAESSPSALAQRGLGALVDAAVQARRIEAMQAAVRVEVITLAVDYAERSAVAFTSQAVSAGERRELARRAVVAELATALRVPERTMQRWVSDAWELAHRLPATLAALRAGTIDEAHTRVIIEETTDLDDTAARSRLDRELALRAESATAAGLRRIARRLREDLLAETLAERHARARAERRIELEPARDGMAWLQLHLPAADALLIHDRIHRIAGEAAEPEDARTPGTARRLAAHAPSFTRLLTHPVSGTVLDVDRTTYRPPADLSRWLQVRDQTCRFPGCARRAVRCDLDHTDDWAEGGRTAFDNLAHLCPRHHRLKHETSWSVAHLGGGTLEWRSPVGRTYFAEPAVQLPAARSPAQTAVRAAPSQAAPASGRSRDGSSTATSSGIARSSTGPPF